MAIWEYRVVPLGFYPDPEETLNTLGEDRWELVSITTEGGEPRAYLKRELVYSASGRPRPEGPGVVTSVAPEPPSRPQVTVRVSGRDDPRVTGWLDTGVDLTDDCAGLSLSITGDVQESSGAVVGPDGNPNRLVLNSAIGIELPSGCLVARVGEEGPVEPVYDSGFLAIAEIGRLYMAINDESYEDNDGEYTISVGVL